MQWMLTSICFQVRSNLFPELLLGVQNCLRGAFPTLEADPLSHGHALRHQDWLHLVMRLIGGAEHLQRMKGASHESSRLLLQSQ